jgi:hypothetical protein
MYTKSLGVTKLLKYELRPSDLPVVLVNEKKHFLKYTKAHFILFFHMLTRCVFSATPNLLKEICPRVK